MNWLESMGLRALSRKHHRELRGAVAEIKQYISQGMQQIGMDMAVLQASLDRFFEAVETEFAQIREAQQKALDDATAALAAADAKNTDLTAALQAQVDANAALLEGTDAAVARLDAKSSELEANDPVGEEPGEGEPGDGEQPVDPEEGGGGQ